MVLHAFVAERRATLVLLSSPWGRSSDTFPIYERYDLMNRREKIEAMLLEEPGDTFLRYSLAMELRKAREHDASLEKLDELTHDETPYVPAFFMAAQQLTDLARIDEARSYLRSGIDEARRQGDSHAAAEMSEMLSMLGEMGEL